MPSTFPAKETLEKLSFPWGMWSHPYTLRRKTLPPESLPYDQKSFIGFLFGQQRCVSETCDGSVMRPLKALN